MLDALWIIMQIAALGFLAWGALLSLGESFGDRSIARHPPDREVASPSHARNG